MKIAPEALERLKESFARGFRESTGPLLVNAPPPAPFGMYTLGYELRPWRPSAGVPVVRK